MLVHPRLGATYVANHGLGGADYQAAFDMWVKEKKYRLVHVESYWSHGLGRVCYAPIFVRAQGPSFAAYHGKSQHDHQALFDDLTDNKGFVPVNMSVVSQSGQRLYTALYEQRDAGAVEARSTLTIAEYQLRFTANAQKGLHLVYVNAYLHQGQLNIVAIWHQKAPAPSVQHHLNQAEYDALLKQERGAGRYTRAVAGYQRGLEPNYVAIWTP